jgi:hypothetical protein
MVRLLVCGAGARWFSGMAGESSAVLLLRRLSRGRYRLANFRHTERRLAILALHLFPANFIRNRQNLPALKIRANDLNGHAGNIGQSSTQLESTPTLSVQNLADYWNARRRPGGKSSIFIAGSFLYGV